MNYNGMRTVKCWRRAVSITPAIVLGWAVVVGSVTAAWARVVVQVSTNDALPGGTLTLEVRLGRDPGDPSVAGAQVDFVLSTQQLELSGACSSDQSVCENGTACPSQGRCIPSCQASSGLTQHSLAAAFPDFQNVVSGRRRLRLPINPNIFPPAALADGMLVTCSFAVLPGALLGPIEIAADNSRFRVTDEASEPVPADLQIQPGSIVSMLVTATATPTNTLPAPSPTPTAEATVTASETTAPTVTPTLEVTATHTQAATSTPSVVLTETIPPPTGTASSSPTRTLPVATSTPTLPVATATIEPTVTRTSTPQPTLSPTDRQPTRTPTSTVRVRKDNDGCSLSADPVASHDAWALMLVWPVSVVVLRRRRRHRASLPR